MRHGRQRAIIILFLWGFAGCREPDPLKREILSLQERTMPPGAKVVEKTNVVRNGTTASSKWEYETDWDWEEYSTWVSNNLAPDYEAMMGGKTNLQFRRRLSGDVFTLQIESGMSNTVQRIRVEFRASPD